MLFRKIVDFHLLVFNFLLTSFKENCQEAHFIRVKFQNLCYKILFDAIHELLLAIFRFGFQSHSEFKLLIVYQSDRRRPDFTLRHLIHELAPADEIVEYD